MDMYINLNGVLAIGYILVLLSSLTRGIHVMITFQLLHI